jgi:hypothetical protein
MVSHSLWWHSTIGEVYAANAVLTALVLLLLARLRRDDTGKLLPWLFFLGGLAPFQHAQMGVVVLAAAAALAVWVRERVRRGAGREVLPVVARCGAAFLVGVVPWAATFASDAAREHSVGGALSQALGGEFKGVMFAERPGHALADVLFLVGIQFPSLLLPFVAAGPFFLARRWKDAKSLAGLAVLFAVNTGFFAFYGTWDKFAFLLPSFMVLALAAAFALAPLDQWLERRPAFARSGVAAALLAAFVVPPPVVYAHLEAWGASGGVFARYAPTYAANLFDVGKYVANPDRRGFREFEDFAAALFARLPPGAVYVDDDSRSYYPLKYLQIYEGGRADVRVELVNAWGIENWGLDPAGFAELLRAAHDRDGGLFLPTLESPYLGWLLRPENVERYRFRRFPLDERRYVYRLVTAGEEKALAPELPRDPVLVVGRRVGSAGVAARTEFSDSDTIAGELRFQRNGEPILFRLSWTAPGGERWSGDEVQVPFGCLTAWSLLDAPRPLAPGAWSVEALSGSTRLGEARFTVRPTSPRGARPEKSGAAAREGR